MTSNEKLKMIKLYIDKQSEDRALWMKVETSSESYFQQRLRDLHALLNDRKL